jgi:hypothetical protein
MFKVLPVFMGDDAPPKKLMKLNNPGSDETFTDGYGLPKKPSFIAGFEPWDERRLCPLFPFTEIIGIREIGERDGA